MMQHYEECSPLGLQSWTMGQEDAAHAAHDVQSSDAATSIARLSDDGMQIVYSADIWLQKGALPQHPAIYTGCHCSHI